MLMAVTWLLLCSWTDQGTTTANNEKKVVRVGKKKGSPTPAADAAAASFGVDGDDVHAIF